MTRVTAKLIAIWVLCCWMITSLQPVALALVYINSDYTLYTNGPYAFNDSLHLGSSANVRVIDAGGVNGGDVVVNLPNGGYFRIDNGGILNLSANGINGHGGSLIVNLAGATGTINIAGTIRANGLGTGNGGTISLSGSAYTLASTAVIEALAGTSGAGGLGGVVNLTRTSGVLSIPKDMDIRTTGNASATQNLITIEGDGVDIDGQLVADGISNSSGGKITLISKSGQVRILGDGDIYARGAGSGLGGTVEFKVNNGATAASLTGCNGKPCNNGGLAVIQHDRGARVNVSGGGGNETGVIRIGRSGSGTIVQDMNNNRDGDDGVIGAQHVIWGDDGGNTTAVTLSNFVPGSHFNGSVTEHTLVATGNITATTGNNFDTINARSNTGTIQITDSSGGMTASVQDTSGATTLIASNGGAITLQDSNVSGMLNIQSDSTITATNNNSVSGDIAIHGTGGNTTSAGAVTYTNTGATVTFDRLVASSATLTTTGSTSDVILQNATITGATDITSGRNITATTANDFTTLSVRSTGGAINITDTTGGLTVELQDTSGASTVTAQGGGPITVQNSDATGSVTLQTDGAITATHNNALTGALFINGDGGAADTAGVVNLTNTNASLDIDRLVAASAILTTTGANHHISADGVNVSGATSFTTLGDFTSSGSYGGSVSGNAARVGIEATSGNFTSGGITASGSSGWYGAADETMIIQTRAGDVLGSGYTTSGAGNMRLQAGAYNYLNAGNNINVNNVSAAQNLGLYATGDTSGLGVATAIRVGGTSSVAGHITASGIDADNYFAPTNGSVDISLSSGNLTTALIWTGGDIYLTASNGSILQDISAYDYEGKTIYTSGADVTLQALGTSGSYINTGVIALGTGSNLTAEAAGKNGSNLSIQLYGRVDGNVSVTNPSQGNTTGNIYLGTDVGTLNDLDDTYTVMDVVGTTTVKSAGDVKLYGMFTGPINVSARTVTGIADKGDLNINQITTTGSGTAVSLHAAKGNVIGGNINAGVADIVLAAGSQHPTHKMSHINLNNVTADHATFKVSGSTTGLASGDAVMITGASVNSHTDQNESGGAIRGNVTITP